MKEKYVRIIRYAMNNLADERARNLVDFQCLSMTSLTSAREFFESRWKKTSEFKKMEILMTLEGTINKVAEMSEESLELLCELIILREKDKEYLPM